MNTLKIALRNIRRNTRRSLMTVLAIAVGAVSMLLFGEFASRIFLQMETGLVARNGHITVFRDGFFNYGAGNPYEYGISDYQSLMKWISEDPELKPMIKIITPTISVFGIAGNFDADTSKTFMGRGMIPSDYNRMLVWDEYNLNESGKRFGRMNEDDETHGFIGVGIARILKLCEQLKLKDCPKNEKNDHGLAVSGKGKMRDFSALAEKKEDSSKDGFPRLDLLSATASGAPNVITFYVDKADPQGFKELDDVFVMMNFKLAQKLVYGRGEHKALGVVLQLHKTDDIPKVRARLEQLIKERGEKLEVYELNELQPFFKQVVGLFNAIFSFISAIMIVIVVFTVVNTMSMSVMERFHEIGTLRALGVKKKGIVLQFVLEGAFLGIIGVSLGLIFGFALTHIINVAGLTWQPPGQATPVPLKLLTSRIGGLVFGIWFILAAVATLASWIPARKAAKMKIVDALGHV